jgi:hypothetical protein
MAKQPPTNKPTPAEASIDDKKKNKRKTASELRHASNVKTLSALGAKRLAEVLLSKSASAEALMDELGI